MELNGQQQRQLEGILVSAFPRLTDLARMVRYGLDANLSEISGSANLADAVFELIEWARAHDRLADLLAAAVAANADHAELRAFAGQMGLAAPAVPGSGPAPAQLTWQERRDLYTLLSSLLVTPDQLHLFYTSVGILYDEQTGQDLPDKIEHLILAAERLGRGADLVAAAHDESARRQEARACAERGDNHFREQQDDAALAEYNRAIDLDPSYAIPYLMRAAIEDRQGQYDEALADFGRAAQRDPADVRIYSNRGLTYWSLKRYDEALADFAHAIQLQPNYMAAYNNRGLVYYALQRYDEALADYTHALQIDPQSARTYLNRSKTYRALGRAQEADADQERAGALDPSLSQD